MISKELPVGAFFASEPITVDRRGHGPQGRTRLHHPPSSYRPDGRDRAHPPAPVTIPSMAVYFANKIPRQPGACVDVSWSRHVPTTTRVPAMCAVSYSTGAVGMYTEEGDDVSAARPVRSDAPGVYPCVLAWHPSAPTLAIGWTDGTVSVWSGDERRIAGEERATHAGRSVTALAWSPTGHRLVTGDDQGTVSVWTLDAKLRPKPSPGFRCAKPNPGARVSHVVVPDDLEDLTEGAEPDTFVFYYAINEGLSDSGHVCMGVDTAVR